MSLRSEERLLETAQTYIDLAAEEIIKRLVSGTDDFAAGAKQHDDMTLVVVKIV
jgi:sigma-B regulation protein RsbU (phosphoserine phosphatase)